MRSPKAHTHPGVAAVLSFVFSGLGQIYNGEIRKGLWLVAGATTGVALVLLGAVALAVGLHYNFLSLNYFAASIILIILGGILVCWTGIYSIFDAYTGADGDDAH